MKPARLLTAVAISSAMAWTLTVPASAAHAAASPAKIMAANTSEAAENYSPNDTVTIKRDDYGVPHVYADSHYDLFFGYGYVLGEDRLFQMEMARRAVLGTSAEVLGEEYIDIDKRLTQRPSTTSWMSCPATSSISSMAMLTALTIILTRLTSLQIRYYLNNSTTTTSVPKNGQATMWP